MDNCLDGIVILSILIMGLYVKMILKYVGEKRASTHILRCIISRFMGVLFILLRFTTLRYIY